METERHCPCAVTLKIKNITSVENTMHENWVVYVGRINIGPVNRTSESSIIGTMIH